LNLQDTIRSPVPNQESRCGPVDERGGPTDETGSNAKTASQADSAALRNQTLFLLCSLREILSATQPSAVRQATKALPSGPSTL